MYDRTQLARGAGLLAAVWGIVGVLILTSGVAVSAPLSGAGGFTIDAYYMSAEEATVTPGETQSTTSEDQFPVAVFEVSESTVRSLRMTKELSLENTPGLDGNLRIVLTADELTLEGVVFETNQLSAERAIWRGFVIDERNRDEWYNQFVSYAGPNPESVAGKSVAIAGSGSEPGFELYEADIKTYSLTADRIESGMGTINIQFQYDPDGDREYEYHS